MSPSLTRRQFQSLLLASGALGSSAAWAADEFPSRTLRFILPMGPGGSGDTLGRAIAEQLSSQLRQPVIVDNRGGADGQIAMQALLSAPADGHTIGLISPGIMAINPVLIKNLSYKVSEVRPIAKIATTLTVLAVGAGSKYTSFEELMAAARKQPDSISFGTYGPSFRIPAIALGKKAGVQFKQVPYKGYNQLLTDLAGGSIDVALVDAGATVGLVESGKLRALAVTSKERFARLPHVRTLTECGLPHEVQLWFGAAVHAQTPETVARRLEEELLKALASPRITELVNRLGNMQLVPTPGKAFAAEIAAEAERNRVLGPEIGGAEH